MNKRFNRVASATGLAAIGIGVLSGVASAATVGAGDAYIVSNDGGATRSGCTVSHVGKDVNTGDKKAFTAGHCGKEGDSVYMLGKDGKAHKVGEIEHVNESYRENPNGADYAVIALDDDVEITNTSTSRPLFSPANAPENTITGADESPTGVGYQFDNFGRPVVKDGGTTGRTYGVEVATIGNSTYILAPVVQGDSGGPVYTLEDGKHVGTVSRGNPVMFVFVASNTDQDIEDYNKGGHKYEMAKDKGKEERVPNSRSFFLPVDLQDSRGDAAETPQLPKLPETPGLPRPSAAAFTPGELRDQADGRFDRGGAEAARVYSELRGTVDRAADETINGINDARGVANGTGVNTSGAVDWAADQAIGAVNEVRNSVPAALPDTPAAPELPDAPKLPSVPAFG